MPPPPKPILSGLSDADRTTVLANLESHVDKSAGPGQCWPWVGGSFVKGYGVFYMPGPPSIRRMIKAHRLAYEAAHNGNSPPTVDHLCHHHDHCEESDNCPHRACCNPAHLEAKPAAANARRARLGRAQQRCRRGHQMDPDNTYETAGGGRRCRRCAADRAQDARAARRLEYPTETPEMREYRPRGMPLPETVEWGLEGQTGDGCWYWRGRTGNAKGYLTIAVSGRTVTAHRLVYQVRIGPIPTGYDVDHTCHKPKECDGGLACPHRACVNPDHLKAVPPEVNTSVARSARRRPTRCKRDHEFTTDNTFTDDSGRRHCLACNKERQRERRVELKRRPGWRDGRYRTDGKCRRGVHVIAEVGKTSNGSCMGCARQRKREHKQRQREGSGATPPACHAAER